MSNTDKITLSLISLKNYIKEHLDNDHWKNEYSIFIANDPAVRGKELVTKVTDSRKQIKLPVVTLLIGTTQDDEIEIGSEDKYDLVNLNIIIQAVDYNQMISLSNIIRKYISGLTFNVYEYIGGNKKIIDTAIIDDVVQEDISDFGSDLLSERFNMLISCYMQLQQ